jgi:Ca2+-transporting ATPase
LPFLPLQTLWVNFTVDILESIGLGMGEPTPGIMQRPPRPANAEILPRLLLFRLAGQGLILAICTLGVMEWGQGPLGETLARTLGFVTFSLASIFLALETADERRSVFSQELRANKTLWRMSLYSFFVTILATELGIFQRILDTTSLTVGQWVICVLVGSVVLWIMELVKLVLRLRSGSTSSAAATAPQVATPPSNNGLTSHA